MAKSDHDMTLVLVLPCPLIISIALIISIVTFLPITHPQSYLPMLFRLWESINSYMYDDRMLHFLSLLAPLHVDPAVSDPAHISAIPDDEVSEGEGRPQFSQDDLQQDGNWHGLYKDVGLFTEHEWNLLMCKCLASMGTFRIEHSGHYD